MQFEFYPHLVIVLVCLIGSGGFIYWLEESSKQDAPKPAIPTEQECFELALVVISANGIENTEVFKRACKLLDAKNARQWSRLSVLRKEFIDALVLHQSIYGQLVPPANALR